MRSTLVSIIPLLVSTALLYLGNGALNLLLGIRLSIVDYPSWVIGAVMSGYFIGQVLGGFNAHRLIAGVGHIRAFASLASILSAATLAHPLLVDPVVWAVLRVIEGYCIAGLAMCTESWLNQQAGNETRGRVLSFYQIAVYLSLGTGQFIVNLGDLSGFMLFVIASILLSLSLVPVATSRAEAPPLPEPKRMSIRQLYAVSPLGMLGTFTSGLVLGSFYALGPFYTQAHGLSVSQTSQFMGLTTVGGLLLQWPIGKLSDHFDRRTVLIWLCVATALTCIGMVGIGGGDHTWLLVLGILYGGFIFTLYPLSVSHTYDHIDSNDLVAASGGMIISYGIGATLGPWGASGVIEMIGPGGLFWFAGISAAMTAMFAFWRMTRRRSVPMEDQLSYQSVPSTSAVASEMDPRGEHEEMEPEFRR